MSSEGATEHIAHFTVDGKGLTRICRQLYVFEQDEYGAIKILQWLHGITMDQIRSVCTGYARLEDQPDGTMKYVPVFRAIPEHHCNLQAGQPRMPENRTIYRFKKRN